MRRDDEKVIFGPNVVQRIEHLRPVRTPVLNSVLLPRLALGDLDSRSISLGLAQGGELRVLQVLKLRGSGFLPGKHAYRLSPQGLHVFPRLADPIELDMYDDPHERMSSGVPALDTMLCDGYYRGASTLLAGPSGVGKTLFALHFVFAGARRGETGCHCHVPGEPGAARTDPARVLLVAA